MQFNDLEFSSLHNAFNAWFSTGHSRFVMALDEGPWQGCVLKVTPAEDLSIQASIRSTTNRADGTIASRHELDVSIQQWPLDPSLNAKIEQEIVERLQGKQMAPPVCIPSVSLPY